MGARWRLLPWLENPGNPAMSPHTVRGTVTHHTVETVERERKRGWEGNCLAMSCHTTNFCTKRQRTPPVYMLRYDPKSYGIPTHAHMCQHCWPPRERKCSLLLTLLNYILMTTFKTGQFGIISKCDKLISFYAEHAYTCMQSFRWISRVEFGCNEFF